MTREEFRDYVDFLRSRDEISYDIYSGLIDGIDTLEQEPLLDNIRTEIEQAADKQFQIAMSVTDLNERYAHIQMENAYRHSINIIDKYKTNIRAEEV